MHIVPKNSLLAPSRAEILGGGRNPPPPHATHNSQGVGMERVKEIKLAKLSVDNKKETRLDILRLLKEKVEAADVSQAISAILK